MGDRLGIEVMKAAELGPSERALWASFRAGSAALSSPYFDLRYTLAAEACAPKAALAVIHRSGDIVGFLPFQRRRGAVLPIGAPLTDFHGVIHRPGERLALGDIAAALDARSYRFTGLTSGEAEGGRALLSHNAMAADLSDGFASYLAARQAAHSRFFKGRRRNRRAIERELGALDFSWSREDNGTLDYVLNLKRAQYHRTRQHDIFACGWTEQLLRTIQERSEPDFGLGFATLRAGGWLASAEIGLLGGDVYHLWLPVYELAFRRFGPGMLMTLNTLEALAAQGVRRVDFGRNDSDYKAYLADPGEPVLEGLALGADGRLSAIASRGMEAAATIPLIAGLRTRARRRLDVITACETNHWRWACGAALALGLMTQGVTPPARTNLPNPRRPDAHRAYPRLDGAADERLSPSPDDVQASAV